jgi:GntR family transcriptional regulator, transcriptional repressor for pyruvate dehydrogenase complex
VSVPTSELGPVLTVSRLSAADQIADSLHEQIVSGAIPRGSKLPTEKELCIAYGVSAITVRAALRSLATKNLIEVRHGVGSFVTVETDSLLAGAMRSLIQLDRITAPEILSVLGSLNGFAAELAAVHASGEDIATMEASLAAVEQSASIVDATNALSQFLDALATASENPLLQSLCRFLGGMQISLAREMAGDSFREWVARTSHLQPLRREIVARIAEHDPSGARGAAINYHAQTAQMILGLPSRGQIG